MSNTWLFQLSADVYLMGAYRQEIWEGAVSPLWGQNKVTGDDDPAAGDRMVCWYARTVSPEPGIVGWGIVVQADEESIRWKPVFPSDLLKMCPLFDDQLVALVDQIRGGFPQGTMWQVSKANATTLFERIVGSVGRAS